MDEITSNTQHPVSTSPSGGRGAAIILLLAFMTGCASKSDPLFLIQDTIRDNYGYINANGDTVIAFGKYPICYTDTFKTYAIVAKNGAGLVGIDRNEKVLLKVYPFDNGPDYPSSGLFRIVENHKIGYADTNGNITIKPQFAFAFPFEGDKAKVTLEGGAIPDGEHSLWKSDHWFYINKRGERYEK